MNRIIALSLFALCSLASAADYPQQTGEPLARSFPYSMIGQLLFMSGPDAYSGSATIIRPRSLLTAGHNLYDFQSGWSTDLLFRRSLYGKSALSEQAPSRLYVLGGYRQNVTRYGANSLPAFAADMAGLVFREPLAAGSTAGWSTNAKLLTGSAFNIALGYGGEFHTGDDLLSVIPTTAFIPVYGAFSINESIYFEHGMSGGPVFAQDSDGNLFVSGVIVSGSTKPVSGGVRILDSSAAGLIRRYLR